MKKILIINGPNLNLLGNREKNFYGDTSLEKIQSLCENHCNKINLKCIFFQSNHEGEIINFLHDERHWAQGIIINPGALAHYSYAIMDAIKAVNIPTVEVHLTNINDRENFRKVSVIAPTCIKQISGMGKYSYLQGVKELI